MHKKAQNSWYVITGGPSVGKTTVLAELKKRGHKIFPELARVVIDEGVAKGLSVEQIRKDEKKFQQEVLKRKQKTEQNHQPSALTFFDRGMQDTLAYMKFYGWEIEEKLEQEINRSKYRKIFLLDPLPLYEQDYARTETEEFKSNINELLRGVYEGVGMKVVQVPYDTPQKRAAFVLDHID